ncbi:hypothetical protein E2C01_070136 [Portunus trituberculatus]|uniref:Uncharacterized protein n=1 Tax=Portunus trituberculatus TaxID=210409 RepID=A0A5B7HWH3_PORTR|nr:hypothetical protein [Portunus trituberculatus]
MFLLHGRTSPSPGDLVLFTRNPTPLDKTDASLAPASQCRSRLKHPTYHHLQDLPGMQSTAGNQYYTIPPAFAGTLALVMMVAAASGRLL